MTRSLSVYLDLTRFAAAIIVVLSHVWQVVFPNAPNPWPGHQAVVIFFVLSGLVVAHAVSRPRVSLTEYIAHRLARVWSVAIPGVILSVLAWTLVETPSLNEFIHGVMHAASNLFFVGEVWFLRIAPPLNEPFWSLNFEVVYYALFGAWIFLSGWRRTVVVMFLLMAAGPKIALLLPVWVAGVVIYRHMPQWSERQALAIAALTIGVIAITIATDVNRVIYLAMRDAAPSLMWRLGQAQDFGGDWLLAPVVALNFAAAARLGRYAAPLYAIERQIRYVAGCTFSVYLYHTPLIFLAFVKLDLGLAPGLALVAATIAVLSHGSERQLPFVRSVLWAAVRRLPGKAGLASVVLPDLAGAAGLGGGIRGRICGR